MKNKTENTKNQFDSANLKEVCIAKIDPIKELVPHIIAGTVLALVFLIMLFNLSYEYQTYCIIVFTLFLFEVGMILLFAVQNSAIKYIVTSNSIIVSYGIIKPKNETINFSDVLNIKYSKGLLNKITKSADVKISYKKVGSNKKSSTKKQTLCLTGLKNYKEILDKLSNLTNKEVSL